MARRDSLASLVLFLVTFAVFSRVLLGDFVRWDDDINIYANPHIQGFSAANWHWIFTTCEYPPRYVPLSWLGWAINYQISGLNPTAYHLTDLLFHAVNASLVFLLIRRLLLLAKRNDSGGEQNRRVWFCSALAAWLWAVHPFRVESVAWAAGRNYVQPFCFLMISLLCYLRFVATAAGKGRRRFYWSSILCFAASLLSFPIGLPLVVVLVVLDFYPLRRFNPGLAGLWDGAAYRIWLEEGPLRAVIRPGISGHTSAACFQRGPGTSAEPGAVRRWRPGHAGVLRLGLLRLETLAAVPSRAGLHDAGGLRPL